MSGKAKLNRKIQQPESQVVYVTMRYNELAAKNKKLNKRVARYRNGFFRRLWLRAKAAWRGN